MPTSSHCNDELAGKTFLVAGATSGIGKSVAQLLADAGAHVVLMARTEQALQDVKATLAPATHEAVPFDATQLETVGPLVEELKQRLGVIDGLVWCVGLGRTGRLRDLEIADMFQAMNGSCFAFLEMVKALMKGKPKQQPLRIVAISSLASTEFQKYLTLYAASKAALEASVRCLAAELGPRNVRINAVRPAFVDTPRLAGLNEVTGSIEESLKSSGYQPLGLITPDEVAKVVLFLLGEASEHINGVSWAVNGGAAC
ncbi:MAG: SDR family oxidoreductase [Desulfovibrio sp.]|nr:SDR family oxidoreductase [Desulfovibrio sp.]